jgi:hypothetical protein
LHPLDQIKITELPESIDGRAECLRLLDEVLMRIDAIPGYDRIPALATRIAGGLT